VHLVGSAQSLELLRAELNKEMRWLVEQSCFLLGGDVSGEVRVDDAVPPDSAIRLALAVHVLGRVVAIASLSKCSRRLIIPTFVSLLGGMLRRRERTRQLILPSHVRLTGRVA
jgi:hypothetical protein